MRNPNRPSTKEVDAALMKLLKNTSCETLAWLCRENEACENIYVADGAKYSAAHPPPGLLPWPVLLLTGTFSKKYVFVRKPNNIDVLHVTKALKNLEHKIKWKWFFAEESTNDLPVGKLISRPPKSFHGDVPKVLKGFITDIKYSVNKFVENNNISSVMDQDGNTPGFVRYALTWLKNHDLQVHPSDKDGIFTIIHRDFKQKLIDQQLSKRWYKSVAWETIAVDFLHAKRSLGSLAAAVSKAGFKRWAEDIRYCIRESKKPDAMVCKSSCTIKTHKPAGQLAARLLHSVSGNILKAASVFVHRMLEKPCAEIPILCSSTDEVQRALLEVHVSPQSCLVKLDVKDFYMSGSQAEFERVCSEACGAHSRLVQHALCTLLGDQFVSDGRSFFRSDAGSGMGMPHSPNVCNLTFYYTVEFPLVGTEPLRRRHGILLYKRYHDDIIFVADSPKSARDFTSVLIRAALPHYILEVDEASLESVPMLDIQVFKTQNGRLLYRPFVKETARHIPLHSSSDHPTSVHHSWPVAEVARMWRRSVRPEHVR